MKPQETSPSYYAITNEPFEDPLVNQLPPNAKKRFLAIEKAMHRRDKSYLEKAEKFMEEYPNIPKIYNFLELFYSLNDEEQKAHNLVKIMYAKFPNYLFAKISFAKNCINDGKIGEFDRIFDGKYTLRDICPNREVFHISEFLAFIDLLLLHACHKKQFEFVQQTIDHLKNFEFIESNVISSFENRLFLFMFNEINKKTKKESMRLYSKHFKS